MVPAESIAEQQGLATKQADSVPEPEGPLQYWILDAQAHKSYGPFDKATFKQKRKEFGIPGFHGAEGHVSISARLNEVL